MASRAGCFRSLSRTLRAARRAAFARAALWVKLNELDAVCAARDRLDGEAHRLSREIRDIAVHCERFDADLDAAIRGNLRRER